MCQVSLTEPGMYIAVSRNAGYRRAPKSTLDSPMTSASSSPSPLEKKKIHLPLLLPSHFLSTCMAPRG